MIEEWLKRMNGEISSLHAAKSHDPEPDSHAPYLCVAFICDNCYLLSFLILLLVVLIVAVVLAFYVNLSLSPLHLDLSFFAIQNTKTTSTTTTTTTTTTTAAATNSPSLEYDIPQSKFALFLLVISLIIPLSVPHLNSDIRQQNVCYALFGFLLLLLFAGLGFIAYYVIQIHSIAYILWFLYFILLFADWLLSDIKKNNYRMLFALFWFLSLSHRSVFF